MPIRSSPLSRAASSVLLFALGWACSGQALPRKAPHIFLITTDALRADHLSLSGYPRETSPSLDAFAAGATHFAQAISVVPKTGPSFTTLFTGHHPRQHGVRYNGVAVPDEYPLLAELLQTEGYRTVAFVNNPVLRAAQGYGRGFDEYFEFGREEGTEGVTSAFRRWADRSWDEPAFVWIHYLDPHGPYQPPSEWETLFLDDEWAQGDERAPLNYESLAGYGPSKVLGVIPKYQQAGAEDRTAVFVARYDAEIRSVDHGFGEILSELRTRDLFEESAVVFTSDHGESLGEHDYYFEHGWFAYDATLRVPLLIRWPGQDVGATRSHQASQLDLLPTLLAVAGVEAPTGGLLGVDLQRDPGERPPVAVESADNYPDKFLGLRTPHWKYLVRQHDSREELYDLRNDPGETQNLAGAGTSSAVASKLEELRSRFRSVMDDFEAAPRAQPVRAAELDQETQRALEALGYGGGAERE